MRLSVVLFTWPKSRPAGNIWIGKNQMVRKVLPMHKNAMEKDIDREKKNIFYCMNPAVTVEQERALYEKIDSEGESPSDTWFRLHKAHLETTTMAPSPLSTHYDYLKLTGTWQKF